MDSLGCFRIRNSDKFILHFNQVCFQIYGMYCIVDSKDNKVDKTREEVDMTPSPFFPKSSKVVQKWPKVSKSVQECPRVVQIHISSFLDRYPSFGSHHFVVSCFKKDVSTLGMRKG